MTAEAASLVATLERRKALGSALAHRLAREAKTLEHALTELRTGRDARVVLAELQARGLKVRGTEES